MGSAVLLAACVSFLDSHIYWPVGVFTMCGLALGFGLLAAITPNRPASVLGPDPL